MNKQDITRLFRYSDWANGSVLDCCAQLTQEQLQHDFKSGHHSVLETLVHMVGADWIWLERWHGKTFANIGGLEAPYKMEGATLESVRKAWHEIAEARATFLRTLDDQTLHAPLAYKNLRGEPFSQPLVDQMQHVVNHATHHRGQIVGFLRALDVKPPTTDMIFYFRTVE